MFTMMVHAKWDTKLLKNLCVSTGNASTDLWMINRAQKGLFLKWMTGSTQVEDYLKAGRNKPLVWTVFRNLFLSALPFGFISGFQHTKNNDMDEDELLNAYKERQASARSYVLSTTHFIQTAFLFIKEGIPIEFDEIVAPYIENLDQIEDSDVVISNHFSFVYTFSADLKDCLPHRWIC